MFREDVIKVTKNQGVANSNLIYLRLIDTLVDQTFLSLEELEGQALKSPAAAGSLAMRDWVDMDCGQLRLSEEFENSGTLPPQSATPKTPTTARTNPFLSRLQSLRSNTRTSTESNDGVHVAQLSVRLSLKTRLTCKYLNDYF